MFLADKLNKGSGTPPDAQFNYVTMLLHGDGTNGAQNNTFLDSSTNNFTITRNGNTTQGSFSPYGENWSNYFGIADSTNRSLSISPSGLSAMTTWTIECFTYSQNGSWNDQVILGPWTPNLIRTSLEVLEVYLAGSQRFAVANGLPKNQWNHLAICCDSSGLRLYVNGTRIGNDTGLTNLSISLASMIIGAETTTSTANDRWNGYISNFRVLNGTALYTGSTYTVPTTALTAITNTALLICQSNRFKDSSANNFTITVNGTPSVQRFNPFGASTAYSTSVIGGSGYFDGSGDYLTVGSPIDLDVSNYTIEFWFAGSIFELTWGTSGGYAPIAINSSGAVYFANPSNSSWQADVQNVIIKDGTWNHYAIVRQSGSTKIFRNGVQIATPAAPSSSTPNGNVTIGLYTSGTQGFICDLRAVVGTAVYTSNFTPPTAPLTAITNTALLCNMTNGAIFDNAMMVDLETAGNAQISTSVKKYGTGSMYFDGTGDYLQYPFTQLIPNGTESFTIECWVNVTANKNYNFIFSAGYPVQIYISSSGIIGTAFNDADNSTSYFGVMYSTTAVTTGTWYHVAVTRSGSNFYLFVNGVLEGTASSSNAIFLSTTYKPTVADALNTGTSAYCFNGYIDDLRITKGYARYTANFTPPTAAFSNTGPI